MIRHATGGVPPTAVEVAGLLDASAAEEAAFALLEAGIPGLRASRAAQAQLAGLPADTLRDALTARHHHLDDEPADDGGRR